jgi:Xaa-Pro aminopeptidase
MSSEFEIKSKRIIELLDRQRIDGVLYSERGNFAWITCGRDNHIANNTPNGVASILFTKSERVCLTSNIEAPRMELEELTGLGIKTVSYPWYDRTAAQKIVRDVIGSKRIVCDSDPLELGVNMWGPGFLELRWSLTDAEIVRYREGGKRTSSAVQAACREVKVGMSEHEVGGILDWQLRKQSLNPLVTLVAADDRIERFRHPIPTDKKVAKYVMLVTCAEYRGLISCMTRFVHFGKQSEELKKKVQAVANIDAAVILATKPGRRLSEIFGMLQKAYAENGFGEQWKLHHQGGPTGYANREAVATPDSSLVVLNNQAFAWNPSVVGVKSEDTIVVGASGGAGAQVLTQLSGDWPRVIGHYQGLTVGRADMLVV